MSKRWVHFHKDCECSRFTDFSISQGKTLVSSIEDIIRKTLPSYTQIPSVVWEDDADVDGSLACHALPENDVIHLAKGSCVTWITTLLAYVHALSHALCDSIDAYFSDEEQPRQSEKDERHCVRWRRAVSWIEMNLVGRASGFDDRQNSCIRDSIAELKKLPRCIEKLLSAPMFLMETETISDHVNFFLSYTIEDTIKQRRQEVSQGKTRWRFQDEFDTIEESMQTYGRVDQGSVVELALELRRDHDRDCKCCSHCAYNPKEARRLIECLVEEVLPLYLPVSLEDPPDVQCALSSKSSKSYIDKRDVFVVNLKRIETYADAVRVVIREWARRFAVSQLKARVFVLFSNPYRRTVAGFSSLLINSFPCDGLLSNWFPSVDCLRLALTPAPIWVDGLVPLMRLNREGATKILADRTFEDLAAHDLDESRQRALSVREDAFYADMDMVDSDETIDYLTSRAAEVTFSPTVCEFRLESFNLDFVSDFPVTGSSTVAEMTNQAINKVTLACNVPNIHSRYEVLFNGELIDESERASDVIKLGRVILVEPIKRRVRVLKGWSPEAFEEVEVLSTITARQLLEKLNVPSPELACILMNRGHEAHGDLCIDTTEELRVFSAGYTFLWATVEVGVLQIRDKIFIDGKDVHAPLKRHLERWQRIYGITGRLLCEGAILDPEASADEKLAENLETNNDDGPLRIEPFDMLTEESIPTHKIQVKNSKGDKLLEIKVKGHHDLTDSFFKICKFTKMSPQSAQLMTTDGRIVIPVSHIYDLFLDDEPCELVLTNKEPPKRPRRKRLNSSKAGDYGPTTKRRLGRFAHPRPSTTCIIISSDSEGDDDPTQ